MPNPNGKNATESAPRSLQKPVLLGLLLAILFCGLALAAILLTIARDPAPGGRAPFVQSVSFDGGASFARTETVSSDPDRARGLSGRSGLADDQAMLFVFEEPGFYAFWMRDMKIPIDIIWLDCDGRVVTIAENVQPETYPTRFRPESPAKFVLETRAGAAAEKGIGPGQKMTVENSSIQVGC